MNGYYYAYPASIWNLILISLPFFVAVTAVIVYANKHFKKFGNIVEDKKDEDANDDSPQLGD
jgi:hypothetical protein